MKSWTDLAVVTWVDDQTEDLDAGAIVDRGCYKGNAWPKDAPSERRLKQAQKDGLLVGATVMVRPWGTEDSRSHVVLHLTPEGARVLFRGIE